MQPLHYPEIPDFFQVPSDLEDAFQAAMAARHTAEAKLHSLTSVVDPSGEQVRAQLLVGIALDCAKLASSLAVCSLGDWMEEMDNPPPFRWRAVHHGRTRRNSRRTVPPGEEQD
jgi:hypothetical protein